MIAFWIDGAVILVMVRGGHRQVGRVRFGGNFLSYSRVGVAKLQPVNHPLRWSDQAGQLIGFGWRVRSGLSSLEDNKIILNKLNHKHKQNCQKFDTKTQITNTNPFSFQISPDPSTKVQEITRSGNHSTRKIENKQIRLGMLASSCGVACPQPWRHLRPAREERNREREREVRPRSEGMSHEVRLRR